jgi:RimJ/RimL family protein N-acetyltransferase
MAAAPAGRGPLDPPVSAAALALTRALPLKPEAVVLRGRFVDLVPYDACAGDAGSVWAATGGGGHLGHPPYDAEALVWRYLWGAPATPAELEARLHKARDAPDSRVWVIRGAAAGGGGAPASSPGAGAAASAAASAGAPVPPGAVVGTMALIANRPENLCVEVAWVIVTPALQATAVATEAAALLLRHAFDAGYRRVEWKTNAHNVRSRAAAERLGFVAEGIFRRHMIVQGGASRDTAWYAMVGEDWAAAAPRLDAWLASDAPAALFAKRAVEVAAMARGGADEV